MNYEEKYLNICQDIIDSGDHVYNERTGKVCLTGQTVVIEQDVSEDPFPMLTTRKVFPKMAIAEIVGYMQGLTNADDFAKIGAPTWLSNANENKAWLANPNRKGHSDCGFIYGAVGHNFGGVDQFDKVIGNLSDGVDDRGEIITYWKPDQFDQGCLRPCMHSFQFSIYKGQLDMTATQRSADMPLGVVSNIMQTYAMLALFARITGHKAGKVTHVINKPHIYMDQVELMKEQLDRKIIKCEPKLMIDDSIKTWGGILELENMDKFTTTGYESHGRIDFPFSE